jgi:hypothetical protein
MDRQVSLEDADALPHAHEAEADASDSNRIEADARV